MKGCVWNYVTLFVVVFFFASVRSTHARTVSVASFDSETGAASLEFSEAEPEDGAKALVAAWSPSDIGNAVTNARETIYVGVVAAAETTKTFLIPAAWQNKAGFVRFFLMADVPPYDARLTYIRSDSNGPWIDTAFVPTTNSDVRVTLATSNKQLVPFGIGSRCYLFTTELKERNSYFCGFMGPGSVNGVSTAVAPAGTGKHELRICAKGAYIDGICYYAFDPSEVTLDTPYRVSLFGRIVDGAIQTGRMGGCTMYSAQIFENGVIERDYVPCLKNNVATLYDRKYGTFCANAGSGAFTMGDEIGPDAEDCGGVESVSDALVFGPELAVTAINIGAAEITVSLTGTHDEGVLYVVADTVDRGTSISDWAHSGFIGKVAASATSVTGPVPGDWLANGYQMRVFWRSAADFPYDHEVEWLYSANSAWINSDVIPNEYTKFSVCGKSLIDVCLFGLTQYFYFFPNGDYKYYYGFFGISGNFAMGNYNPETAFRTYTMGPGGVEIDGTQIVDFSGRATTYSKMKYGCPVFYRRDYGNGWLTKTGSAWVKWAKVWEDGRLVCDFVPCVSNNVAYMYDRVHRAFLPNQSATPFEPGETVVNVADDEVVIWSDAFNTTSASVTWDGGGGADTSFATPENWDGDTLPDFTNGTSMLTFATGGAAAQIPSSGAYVGGICFDTANDFAITAAPGGTLSLGGGGVVLADRALSSGSWRLHDLDLPVTLVADQTWQLSTESTQRIRLLGNLQGDAARTLTVTGNGCLSIYSTNDFAGNVELAGGVMKVFSKERPFGSGAEGGEIIIDQSKGASLEMWGAVIDKPIRITSSATANSGAFCARPIYGDCAITAPIYQSGGDRFAIYHDPGTMLTISGGGTFAGPVAFYPENTTLRKLVIEGDPIIQSKLGDRNKAFNFHGKTELHLKNQGNRMYIELGGAQAGRGSSLHCWTNDVLNYTCDIILGYGSTLDLHGFDQQFGDVQTGSAGHIRSDTPATFLAFYEADGITWGANSGVDGAASFKKSGPKPMTINGTNTTTGALIAFAGRTIIGETGVWQGTDVQIGTDTSNRHPSLRLTHNNCFANPTKTILTMTTTTGSIGFNTDAGSSRSPELVLDEGVTALVREI
ncbi:MAG: hypothetical protein IKR48_12870, partial [Kiritimatiellae bacterium]|nr:hypothetical protein [Kiritimatiellia bacterium]